MATTDLRFRSPNEAPVLRWGVLGAGWIAGLFAQSLLGHTRSTIQAVASRDHARGEVYATKYQVPVIYSGDDAYNKLVADENVDAIYIATPHSFHREHALLAIAAGKPVLVEKAFTRNLSEAQDVIDAAQQSGVFAMEAMWTRFLPHMIEARRLVDDGFIGDVINVSADFGGTPEYDPASKNFNPALAGGSLLDLGVYPINLVHDFLGAPESVTAVGGLAPTGVDDRETVILNYPSKRASGVALSTFKADTARIATVSGTTGRIEFAPGYFGPSSFRVMRQDKEVLTFNQPVTLGWQYQLAEVAFCVADGRKESAVMPHSATLEVMSILDQTRAQLGVSFPGE